MALDKAFYKKYGFNLSNALGSGCKVMCITGGRSTGKTYTAKRQAIKEFIERGWQFAYVRHYDEEIKKITAKKNPRAWFADIIANDEFPGYDFRMNGREAQCARVTGDGKPKWETMGMLYSLCQAQAYKGDVAPDCHLMIFDEFIREKRGAGYPPGCVDALMNLWETLDRRQNRVRILMLANAADVVNPFYAEWHITPPAAGHHKRVYVGRLPVYVEHAKNADFEAAAAQSNIGLMTEGSAYGAYALENVFANASSPFVRPRPRRARAQANILWDGRWFGVWMNLDTLGCWMREGRAEGASMEFCLFAKDAEPNILMIEHSAPYLKGLARLFRIGQLTFDRATTANRVIDMLRLCGVR